MYKSLVWSPKNLSQEHIDVCKKYPVQCPAACGVEVPREKVCNFVGYLLRQFILFPCKSHTRKIKLNRGSISLISEYWKVAYDLQNVRQSQAVLIFPSHPYHTQEGLVEN